MQNSVAVPFPFVSPEANLPVFSGSVYRTRPACVLPDHLQLDQRCATGGSHHAPDRAQGEEITRRVSEDTPANHETAPQTEVAQLVFEVPLRTARVRCQQHCRTKQSSQRNQEELPRQPEHLTDALEHAGSQPNQSANCGAPGTQTPVIYVARFAIA